MKKILGLDLGTNSIGWSVIENDFDNKTGKILGIGSRIIPMSQDILGKFDSGQSISQTAERTGYRGVRRLYQRDNLRRERLHRVLNILDFLPEHYKNDIDFEKKFGQFKPGKEPKINYAKNSEGKYKFLFMDSFLEMAKEFEQAGQSKKIPLDWTIYYLRKKALKEKISKEELAWILLNFNQKRGYYQLRGDELNNENKKDGKYYQLTVKEIKETEDKNAKGIWYEVRFEENDWIYKRQSKEPLNNWIGTKREFIVTTTIDKKGEIKRSFRAPKEDDWGLVKTKTQQDIDTFNKQNNPVGVVSYIYTSLLQNPAQKIRGKLIKTIERDYYKQELEKILEKQIELQPELFTKEKYLECINELYPRNEAHFNNIKDKDFIYLFVDDIIFYQRPLKSKKSTISGCQFEYRVYNKINKETGKSEIVKEPIKAISKSHPLYQEFRLWQFISNLKIYKKEDNSTGKLEHDVDVTSQFLPDENVIVELFDFLNDKKEIEQKHVLDFFVKQKTITKKQANEYRWNYVEDKKYPGNETRAQFLSRLKKVAESDSFALSEAVTIKLWHIIYSVKDPEEFRKALSTFAHKNNLDENSFVEAFENFPPFKNDYGAFSEKALKKILPLMRRGKCWNEQSIPQEVKDRITQYMERVNAITVDINSKDFDKQLEEVSDDEVPKQLVKSFLPFKGKYPLTGLNTYQACYAVYGRHSEANETTKWHSPKDIDKYLQKFKQHSLRNPIVEQVITETLRTVKDIWKEYGDFDEIHVELGREMKNPADKRKQMTTRNKENENTNNRIKQLLYELMNDGVDVKPYSHSQQEILKIYEEGIINNPNTKYTSLKQEDVEKIRKNQSPSKAKSTPTESDIKKYKLWLEQGYISPYTGAIIPLNQLFTTNYQIEHIIPQSRYFDNSLSNKAICESEVNELKSNQTAYEFIKNNEGRIVELQQGKTVTLFTLSSYETHCNKYFKNNRAKLGKLLSEEIPEGFIERQMNDSRYISKVVKNLLSNIVREEGEQEATSKNLVPVTGAITSKLKQDWGLNDKWNEIILPRFKRLNAITNRNDFTALNSNNVEIPNVPDDIGKVEKKRIDHRHHALDALVIACTGRKHIQYLNSLKNEKEKYDLQPSLMVKNKEGHYTKHFIKPWNNFTVDAKEALDKTIVSFKQNLRVINRTNNKTLKWVEKEGRLKKQLVKQKGKNFAIRKPMHKETVSGKVLIRDKKTVSLNTAIDEQFVLVDKVLNKKIKDLKKKGFDNKQIKKYFKDLKSQFNNKEISKVEVYYFFEATATRTALTDKFTSKQLEKITDSGIKKILKNHLKNYLDEEGKPQYNLAFNPEGIEALNKNIVELNNGKPHQPIYKVRLYEQGSKFPVSQNENNAKSKKYVEAAKNTNLFFAIYWDKENQKRVYETVPLNVVIEHQKQTVHLPKNEKLPIPIDHSKGDFLFYLSPNDLVYVPTDEELENPNLIDFKNLTKEQVERILKIVSFSNRRLYAVPYSVANTIYNKFEYTQLNKIELIREKEYCWKLKVNRLGEITGIEKYF